MTPKKLTRAEAGRLGGLRTKQRHGTEHFRRAGKLGGKALVDAHGPEHMAQIGRKGFCALAGRIGCYRSRRAAVQFLQGAGRLTAFPIEAVVKALAAIPADPSDQPGQTDRAVAAILVSIRKGEPQP
jgi:hypothetical protein